MKNTVLSFSVLAFFLAFVHVPAFGEKLVEESAKTSTPDLASATKPPLKPHFSVDNLKASSKKTDSSHPDLLKQDGTLKSGKLDYTMPFSALFKYDTSPDNTDHKCYDFRKPLTKHQTFLFNFMSKKKYNIDSPE